MRSVFFGTPQAAIPALEALKAISDVQAVITRPDSAQGRSGALVPSDIATEASELGLPVLKPEHRREIPAMLSGLGPVDVGVVVAFGMILTKEVLDYPSAGMVNVHFSLLPRWRGAAPVERAILAGDTEVGVTLMSMDEGLDTGPIIAARTLDQVGAMTAGEMTGALARLGAGLLDETLAGWVAGTVSAREQADADAVTYAAKLSTDESRLSCTDSAEAFERKGRAFNPRPGAHGYVDGERFKVLSVDLGPGPDLDEGQLAMVDGRLWLGTGDRSIELLEVQPAGRKPMAGSAWARGRRDGLGEMT